MLCFNSAGELWVGEHSSNAGIKQDTEAAAFFTAPTTDTEVAAKADTASVASEGTWALSQKTGLCRFSSTFLQVYVPLPTCKDAILHFKKYTQGWGKVKGTCRSCRGPRLTIIYN